MYGLTWEEPGRELVQRDGHDFGREAEGVFHTCAGRRTGKAFKLLDSHGEKNCFEIEKRRN